MIRPGSENNDTKVEPLYQTEVQPLQKPALKVALVHDFLNQFGGAERVLLALHKIFPEAPIYTLLYDKEKVPQFASAKIIASDLQKLPKFIRKKHRLLLPFYPSAIEKFDFSGYDLVISSSGAFSKNIITRSNTKHICYCHSPMRYAWDYSQEYLREKIKNQKSKIKSEQIGGIKGFVARLIINWLRVWDWSGKDRVDLYLANSEHTAARIKKYYRKDSIVVYPPVKVSSFEFLVSSEFRVSSYERKIFLCVGRLSAYKKIDLVVRAFNQLKFPLIIVGEGSEKEDLEKLNTSPLTKFVGSASDEDLAKYYSSARALIFPNEEDFGIVPVEAMLAGTPVIAYGQGGLLETVVSLKTGLFFEEQTPEAIAEAVKKFIVMEQLFDHNYISIHAQQFSEERFIEKIREVTSDEFRVSSE